MAWSDAARQAALAARRLHAQQRQRNHSMIVANTRANIEGARLLGSLQDYVLRAVRPGMRGAAKRRAMDRAIAKWKRGGK